MGKNILFIFTYATLATTLVTQILNSNIEIRNPSTVLRTGKYRITKTRMSKTKSVCRQEKPNEPRQIRVIANEIKQFQEHRSEIATST